MRYSARRLILGTAVAASVAVIAVSAAAVAMSVTWWRTARLPP